MHKDSYNDAACIHACLEKKGALPWGGPKSVGRATKGTAENAKTKTPRDRRYGRWRREGWRSAEHKRKTADRPRRVLPANLEEGCRGCAKTNRSLCAFLLLTILPCVLDRLVVCGVGTEGSAVKGELEDEEIGGSGSEVGSKREAEEFVKYSPPLRGELLSDLSFTGSPPTLPA